MPFRLRLCNIFLIDCIHTHILQNCYLVNCHLTNYHICILQTIMFSCKLYHNLLHTIILQIVMFSCKLYHNLLHTIILQTIMFSCKLYHSLLQTITFLALGHRVQPHRSRNFGGLEECHLDSGSPR